jgi:hypothetical protein
MSGFVFYRGPSQIDGSPIVGIVLIAESSNEKTGAMCQTYIIRSDVHPVIASQTGEDFAICGDCKHRGRYRLLASGAYIRIDGSRSCYVQLNNGPASVYRALQDGLYADLAPADIAPMLQDLFVRLGAYGDPAAIPYGAWLALLAYVAGVTGYTHQWAAYPEFAIWCMASVDSPLERVFAKALGFRTFRVAPSVGWEKEKGEGLCPASKQAGRKLTCISCMACGGHSAPNKADMMIPDHGPKRARPRRIETR